MFFNPIFTGIQHLRELISDYFLPKRLRIIETIGCMAADGPTVEGIITRRIVRNCYNGSAAGVNIPFFVVRIPDGREKEVPVQDAYPAKDGVLEYRW